MLNLDKTYMYTYVCVFVDIRLLLREVCVCFVGLNIIKINGFYRSYACLNACECFVIEANLFISFKIICCPGLGKFVCFRFNIVLLDAKRSVLPSGRIVVARYVKLDLPLLTIKCR